MPTNKNTLDKSINIIKRALPKILEYSPSPEQESPLVSFEQLGISDAPPSVPYILELIGGHPKNTRDE